MPLPPEIEAAIDAALKPVAASVVRSRVWSEEEYWKDITTLMSGPLPPLSPEAQAGMDEAIAALLAIFTNAPPRKPGRHPLSPGMLTYDLFRLRNGDLVSCRAWAKSWSARHCAICIAQYVQTIVPPRLDKCSKNVHCTDSPH